MPETAQNRPRSARFDPEGPKFGPECLQSWSNLPAGRFHVAWAPGRRSPRKEQNLSQIGTTAQAARFTFSCTRSMCLSENEMGTLTPILMHPRIGTCMHIFWYTWLDVYLCMYADIVHYGQRKMGAAPRGQLERQLKSHLRTGHSHRSQAAAARHQGWRPVASKWAHIVLVRRAGSAVVAAPYRRLTLGQPRSEGLPWQLRAPRCRRFCFLSQRISGVTGFDEEADIVHEKTQTHTSTWMHPCLCSTAARSAR